MNRICILFLFYFSSFQIISAQEIVNLSGEWQFKLDPENRGEAEKWFNTSAFEDIVRLPGCLQEQGYGFIPNMETQWWTGEKMDKWFEERPWLSSYTTPENFEFQEFLKPDRHYLGAAWYATEIQVPANWDSKAITLFLERAHWQTKLWVDGKFIGEKNSLATAHIYSLDGLEPGKHRVVLRIDNSELIRLGRNPHSVSEQTAGTWNGIVGKLELRGESFLKPENIQLYPDAKNKEVSVTTDLNVPKKLVGKAWKLFAIIKGIGANKHQVKQVIKSGNLTSGLNKLDFEIALGEGAQLWDEFNPNLYELELQLYLQDSMVDLPLSTSRKIFGLREFKVSGKGFTVNGIPTFLRGNVDCAVFPKTGYAPMDVESWKKVFKVYKDFGLNMARFHSWCPPEAAFIAADEIGIYLAPEVGEWVGVNSESQYEFLSAEAKRILAAYGNHASFIQMGLGNEARIKDEYATALIEDWKSIDSRHLYTIKANSNSNPENIDYEVVRKVGNGSKAIRYQDGWPPKPMNSAFQSKEPGTQINWQESVAKVNFPLIQHETAQICAYPDVMSEIPKYTGYLNPSYLTIAAAQLRERGMINQLPQFVEASGKWQVELTKEEFEAAYRTKDLGGFHWLCLADFTGQNSAPVGFTDAFYDTKSYVKPEYVRNWNAPTVLLAAMPKRVYASLDDFQAEIMVSHFGNETLELEVEAALKYDDGKLLKDWKFPLKQITQGNAQALGMATLKGVNVDKPIHLKFELQTTDKKLFNSWDLWVFPEVGNTPIPDGITVSKRWNSDVESRLNRGETVLLMPGQEDLKGQLPICFTNYYWTSFGANEGQSSAAGILIDTKHPVFKDFPTEEHVNWQWWDVLTYAHPMILDSYDTEYPFPKSYRAPLQPIDTWKINRKLSLLTELKVGKGKLLICSIDMDTNITNRPVTAQLRRNLLKYISSEAFNPTLEVSVPVIEALFDTKKQ